MYGGGVATYRYADMSDSSDPNEPCAGKRAYTTTLGAPLYRSKSDREPLLFLPSGVQLTILEEGIEVLLVETDVRQRGYLRRSDVLWKRERRE